MGLGQRLGPRLGRQPLACESTGTIQALPYILMRSLKTCGARRGKGYVRHTRGWHTCSGAHELPGKGRGEGWRAALRLRYVQHAGGRHAHVQHSLPCVST